MRGMKTWLLPLAAIPFLALLGYGLTRDTFVLPSPLEGRSAPEFRLETMSGDSLSMDDLRGRVVVLNFWASWCVPCRVEHPALLKAHNTYDPEEAVVVGVVYQDSKRNAERFLDRFGGGWKSVLDPGTRMAIDFGVYGVPETFFIGRDGSIARKHIGPVNWELVQTVVDSLLALPAPGQPESAWDTVAARDVGESPHPAETESSN